MVPVHRYTSAPKLSPDGGWLYVASNKPQVHLPTWARVDFGIDTATFTLIDGDRMQFSPAMIIVNPDSSAVYTTRYNENAISAIELASRFHTLIGLDDAPLDVAVSPDRDQL